MMMSRGVMSSSEMMIPFHRPVILIFEVAMKNPAMIQKINAEIIESQVSFMINIGITSTIPAPIHNKRPRWSFFIYLE